MPINFLGQTRYPEGYQRGPGLDSKGQAGPTLQRIADEYKTKRSNAGLLETLFENVAPLAMYSGDAEASHIPSNAMKNASRLANVFTDWFKNGTPTINLPFDRLSDIIRSGKFKNQMELAGKEFPEAWKKRIEVEKQLGGFPYPRIMKKKNGLSENDWDEFNNLGFELGHAVKNHPSLATLNAFLRKEREFQELLNTPKLLPEYSESLAKKNPVYGHIYNPKYTHQGTARSFGDTSAEMSQHVKDNSGYVLGDSFNPFVKKLFSSDDMLGNTSRLERALFDRNRPDWKVDHMIEKPQDIAHYMEMWVPNHLARINNINSVHINPGSSEHMALPISALKEDSLQQVNRNHVQNMQWHMDNLKDTPEEAMAKYSNLIDDEDLFMPGDKPDFFHHPLDDKIPF